MNQCKVYDVLLLFSTKYEMILNMLYHLSALDREYNSLAATNLLIYEATCWSLENRYKSIHLGEVWGSKEDSLYKFKKAFNINSETFFSVGEKIFKQEKYDELLELRFQEDEVGLDSTFSPKYRK